MLIESVGEDEIESAEPFSDSTAKASPLVPSWPALVPMFRAKLCCGRRREREITLINDLKQANRNIMNNVKMISKHFSILMWFQWAWVMEVEYYELIFLPFTTLPELLCKEAPNISSGLVERQTFKFLITKMEKKVNAESWPRCGIMNKTKVIWDCNSSISSFKQERTV